MHDATNTLGAPRQTGLQRVSVESPMPCTSVPGAERPTNKGSRRRGRTVLDPTICPKGQCDETSKYAAISASTTHL